MQLRLKPKASRSIFSANLAIKTILIISILFLGIFLLDKIDLSVPTENIKQEISNDKFITLK
jgi:hypothetical protein